MSLAFTNAVSAEGVRQRHRRPPGIGPGARGEAVIYTAHHDHLGIKPGAKPGDDAIYNGALDNASGVAAILSIARAFASLKPAPARSVYFAFVAGEEQGLLGSEYLAKHPPVPAGRIAANINVDGIGCYGKTRDVGMIGLGKSSLDADVDGARGDAGPDAWSGDEFPDRGTFYRSDQFNFARVGVPGRLPEEGDRRHRKARGLRAASRKRRTRRTTTTSRRTSSARPGTSRARSRTCSSPSGSAAASPTRRRCRAGTRATSSRRRG